MNTEQNPDNSNEDLIDADIAKQLVDEVEGLSDFHLPEVRKIVVELFDGQEPDAMFTHSGNINKSQKTGAYRTTTFTALRPNQGLVTGSRTRVIAAAEVSHAIPNLKIVTNSYNRLDPNEPVMARVVKNELVKRGVKPEKIQTEELSFNTITQLAEMVNMAVHNKWTKIVALTNEFHLPRMIEMYNRLDSIIDDSEFQETLKIFKELNPAVKFISAEQILQAVDPRYVEYFKKVKGTPEFRATVEAEVRGLADLKAGKYRAVLNPEVRREHK